MCNVESLSFRLLTSQINRAGSTTTRGAQRASIYVFIYYIDLVYSSKLSTII